MSTLTAKGYRLADGFVASHAPLSEHWEHEPGIFLRGLGDLYEHSRKDSYLSFLRASLDPLIDDEGRIRSYDPKTYELDNIVPGRALFTLWRATGDERYLAWVRRFAERLSVVAGNLLNPADLLKRRDEHHVLAGPNRIHQRSLCNGGRFWRLGGVAARRGWRIGRVVVEEGDDAGDRDRGCREDEHGDQHRYPLPLIRAWCQIFRRGHHAGRDRRAGRRVLHRRHGRARVRVDLRQAVRLDLRLVLPVLGLLLLERRVEAPRIHGEHALQRRVEPANERLKLRADHSHAADPPLTVFLKHVPDQRGERGRHVIAQAVREILEAIGEDPDRPGLKQTPQRVADLAAAFQAAAVDVLVAKCRQALEGRAISVRRISM